MDNEPVILLLYVDDLVLTGEEKLIAKCKHRLVAERPWPNALLLRS
jgi:hypothetical protein